LNSLYSYSFINLVIRFRLLNSVGLLEYNMYKGLRKFIF
jgi:hypothetical protein